MGEQEATILELLVCAFALCLFFVLPSIRRVATVGLPFCYLICLGMIHWIGALIHVLPWNTIRDPYVHIGFRQAFLAVVAFVAGSVLIAPAILAGAVSKKHHNKTSTVSSQDDRLPTRYLLIGMIFYAVLAPAARFIPSIAAVSVCGVYLIVVGLCLACWRAHIQHSAAKLCGWLILVSSIPFLTVVTLGFIGYGAVASLLVFTFVAAYYRPRWQAAVGLSLLIFLGLSLFVTYARDRQTIRNTVWGGADYSQRVEKMTTMLQDFEVIDFGNRRHLKFINARLNQNYLVGAAVQTIATGRQQYAAGETLYEALLALVPRVIWPGKPVRAGSGDVVSRYTRIQFAEGTSVGIGQVMEFYINFGSPGVIVGFFIIGILITVLDGIAAFHLRVGDWEAFMSWFLPSISLLNVGGSLVEVAGTAASSMVLVFVVSKAFPSRMQDHRDAPNNVESVLWNRLSYGRAPSNQSTRNAT